MKKKVKVVMLPTERSNGVICKHLGADYKTNWLTINPISNNQHLYLVSDEEIKEGDWYVDLDNQALFQSVGENKLNHIYKEKKVIATTDKSLSIKTEQAGDNVWCQQLPQIPESFIKAYVEANGEIDEVEVEYNKCTCDTAIAFDDCDYAEPYTETKGNTTRYKYRCNYESIKTTSNNEVIIHLEEEKMYDVHKVKQLLYKLHWDTKQLNVDFNKWIKENL